MLESVYTAFLPFATRLLNPLSGKELHHVCGSGEAQRERRLNCVRGLLPLFDEDGEIGASRCLGGYRSSNTSFLG